MPEESSPPPPSPPTPKGPRKVTSLTEILEASAKRPPRAEPIVLEWWLPPPEPTKENPKPEGEVLCLEIQTRFSADQWLFGIRYMTDVQELLRNREANAKGELVQVHPLADILALTREIVTSPTWLHNESALAQLTETMPPNTFAEMRRKLMLGAGLDGDFFVDYHALSVPKAISQAIVSGYANGSDSPPTPSMPPTPPNSSPGSSTIGTEPPKNGELVSATTSGSLQ